MLLSAVIDSPKSAFESVGNDRAGVRRHSDHQKTGRRTKTHQSLAETETPKLTTERTTEGLLAKDRRDERKGWENDRAPRGSVAVVSASSAHQRAACTC